MFNGRVRQLARDTMLFCLPGLSNDVTACTGSHHFDNINECSYDVM